MKKKVYTVFIDGKLWINCIDDMNSTASWAMGGIIFTSKKAVRDFIKDLKRYNDWRDSKFEVKEIKFSPLTIK